MPASLIRRIFRLQLGVNRKLTATRWIGTWTVEVQVKKVCREKASKGAEKSFPREKAHRGQRSSKKRVRGGKPRPKVDKRPSVDKPGTRSSKRFAHVECWEEKVSQIILDRYDEIKEWEQSQKKRDSVIALRKRFLRTRVHLDATLGGSISWPQFLYLTRVDVWRANCTLRMTIVPVDPRTVFKELPIHFIKPKRQGSPTGGVDTRPQGMKTKFCRACGDAVFIKGKRVFSDPHIEHCRAARRPVVNNLPLNKRSGIEEQAKFLRPPAKQALVPRPIKSGDVVPRGTPGAKNARRALQGLPERVKR